jgi:hypothetical protein
MSLTKLFNGVGQLCAKVRDLTRSVIRTLSSRDASWLRGNIRPSIRTAKSLLPGRHPSSPNHEPGPSGRAAHLGAGIFFPFSITRRLASGGVIRLGPRRAAGRERPSPVVGYAPRVSTVWDPGAAGVLRLPSGRLVRGRGLRLPLPAGPVPDFALYLLSRQPPPVPWETRWVRWPDFWLPADKTAAERALHEAWERAAAERVEIACTGGHGRTGTALACLAVLDGLPGPQAIAYVRQHYAPGAIETPWQRRFATRFH